MPLLGIDYGSKRIGIAKSDEAGIFAHGFCFIHHKTDEEDIRQILRLIADEKIVSIVIGHPIHMNGTRGAQAAVVERFAEKLRASTAIHVELWDERLSSSEAERYLIAADTSRKKRKTKVDQLAAQIILQSYMDSQRKE